MTQLSIQKELVDDRRRDLAAHRHGSASPVRFEAQRPAQTEPRRWRTFSLLRLMRRKRTGSIRPTM